jgi:hypothetical protein
MYYKLLEYCEKGSYSRLRGQGLGVQAKVDPTCISPPIKPNRQLVPGPDQRGVPEPLRPDEVFQGPLLNHAYSEYYSSIHQHRLPG